MGPILALFHVFYFGVWRPVAAIRRRGDVHRDNVNRAAQYRRVTLDSGASGFLSVTAVFLLGPTHAWPLLEHVQWGRPGPGGLTIGAVMLGLMAWIDAWHSGHMAKSSRGHYLLEPPSPADRPVWMAMAAVTGISEELTWRLAQPVLIGGLTGSSVFGIAASAVGFGIGHIRSGLLWAVLTGGFALAFQAVTLSIAGGLWVAMAVHVGINVAAGLRRPTTMARPSP